MDERPETNVFCARQSDLERYALPANGLGMWFWAEPNWHTFHGPYASREPCDIDFQVYMRDARMCPGCEE